MTKEQAIKSFKKYIIFQESTLNDYYKMDEEFYKDQIEQLELSTTLLETVLSIIEEQDKIIDMMAEDIYRYQIECDRYFKDKEEVKQYFEYKGKES